ncbi:MAG TPA: hypothetical protein VHR45_09990 [Thermoanaerobaculia bacterium]|nr:hypothetical protein [Thermoanaerobaculia bacterium]
MASEADGAAAGRAMGGASRCNCLRWKGMFIDVEPDHSIPNPHDGFFWCRHTLTCLGPDGQVADEGSCRAGRECFEGW